MTRAQSYCTRQTVISACVMISSWSAEGTRLSLWLRNDTQEDNPDLLFWENRQVINSSQEIAHRYLVFWAWNHGLFFHKWVCRAQIKLGFLTTYRYILYILPWFSHKKTIENNYLWETSALCFHKYTLKHLTHSYTNTSNGSLKYINQTQQV